MLGGYQILDFKGNTLSSEEVVVKGIYDKIEGTKKPLLIEGVVIDSIEKKPVFAEPKFESAAYTFSCYGGTIAVTADDSVTYTAS